MTITPINPINNARLVNNAKPINNVKPINNAENYNTFHYQFNVFLKGPIEIRDDRGMIIASVGEEAICMIKYDQIVGCHPMGGPDLPDAVTNGASANGASANANTNANATNATNANATNRNQGGRRSTRSKSKRKTRRTNRRV
jgi:hypothetical protein